MFSRSHTRAILFHFFSAGAVLLAILAAGLGAPPARAQPEGTVAGVVTDAETGRPLPGVNVLVEDGYDDSPRGASTGPQGRFVVGALAPGRYTLEVCFVGYAPASREVYVAAGDTTRMHFFLMPRTVGLEAVEVTARRAGTPGASEQLRKAAIQEANPRDAGELLRKMPGTSAVRRGAVGLDPVVRGLRSGQVGVYVDGMRTMPAGPARMDSPLSHTGPSTMQSIEVAKGPYALTWGGSQLSAVRVETNGLFSVPHGERLSGQVKTGYDTNFNSYDLTGTANGRAGAFAYRVDGAYRRGSAYESGDGREVAADFLNRELRAKVGYELGPDQRLTAGGGYQRQDDVAYPGRLLSAQFFKSGRGRIGYEYTPDAAELVRSVTAKAYGYQTLHTMNNEDKPTYRAGTFPDGSRRPPLRIAVNADITTVGGRVATELAPTEDLRLKLGADAYRAYRDAERPFQVVMNGEPKTPGFYQSDQIWPGVSTLDAGAFAQATRLFGKVEATATARADAVWANADEGQVTDVYLDIAEPGEGALDRSALDQQEVNVSGAARVSAPLSEVWTLSAGAGTAVRTAGALERYSDRFPSNKAQTSAEFIGNPRLEPERSWQADLELKGRYDHAAFKVSGFARRLSNYITLTDAPDVEPMLPLPIFAEGPFRYTNGTATFYGGEASASWAALPSLTASASGSYLWGKNLETTQPALGVAPLRGDLGLRYEPPQGHFYVESTLSAAAEQNRVARMLGETPTAGYVTLDLKAGLDLGRGLSLEAGVTNLTDTGYINHLNAKNPYSSTPIPEPGRVFFLGVAYDF